MELYQKWCLIKAKPKLIRLLKFYDKKQSLLDVGSGNCALNILLKKEGINVKGLDIVNKSAFRQETPIIYDGYKLPFKDNEFDVVQIITVLHHVKDPINIVKEAKRVGKRIIIMEDIYENVFQKYVTWIADSINNWEFIGHPHTNKTDEEWKKIFNKNNLTVTHSEYYNFLLFFKQVTYVLDKK